MTDQESPHWERQVLEKVAMAAIVEQRRGRRWGIAFKILGFLYLFLILVMAAGWFGHDGVPLGPHTALVDIQGVLSPDEVNADTVISGLQSAFENKHTKGVLLRINSPGGSPVQAGQINDEIRRLRKKYPKVPLYAVVDDLCASGGYYIAAAADKIYVDKASLIGSIGVLMDGFGFTGSMEKLGVERRLLTAGDNKGFLDPFSPLDPEQVKFARLMLDEIHHQFIQVVREGRGKRLKNDPAIFSGLVWNGQKSIELGLADALGSADFVAREVIKAEDIIDYTRHEGLAERLAKRVGSAIGEHLKPYAAGGPALR
jgi:protease IV